MNYIERTPNELNLLPGEQIILRLDEVIENKRSSHKVLSVLLILIGIFLLAFYVGIILIAAGIYLYLKGRRGNEIQTTGRVYLLTNKRAIEREADGTIKQVSLFESTPSLRNVRLESISTTTEGNDKFASTVTTQVEIGDVIFIKNGKVEVEFNNIQSPRDVVSTVENIIKSTVG